MIKLALFARFEAKPGKEKDVAAFRKVGLQMANQEAKTPIWFALQLSPSVFGVLMPSMTKQGGRRISPARLPRP